MTTTDPANTTGGAAVAAPVDRPVRPLARAVLAAVNDFGSSVLHMPGVSFKNSSQHKALLKTIRAAIEAEAAVAVAAADIEWYGKMEAADSEIARLRARVLELEAVHEDASGAVLQERERWQQWLRLRADAVEAASPLAAKALRNAADEFEA